jgi:hypothetical protein
MEYITRVGDNGIYTKDGEKVAIVINEFHLEDVIDALNLNTEDTMNDDQKELLEHLGQHEIDSIPEIDKLLKFKEKHEANEQHWDEIHDTISNMLAMNNWRDEEIDKLNEVMDTLKLIDVKQTDKKWLEKQQKRFDTKVKKEVDKQVRKIQENLSNDSVNIKFVKRSSLPNENEKPET